MAQEVCKFTPEYVEKNGVQFCITSLADVEDKKGTLESIFKLVIAEFGENYSTLEDFTEITTGNEDCCLFAFRNDNKEIVGARIMFSPGNWRQIKTKETTTGEKEIVEVVGLPVAASHHSIPINKSGYSFFIVMDNRYQGLGIGGVIMKVSVRIMKEKYGAQAITAHVWGNSPNNSAVKFAQKNNAKIVFEHKKPWLEYGIKRNWKCTGCNQFCICDGVEVEYIL